MNAPAGNPGFFNGLFNRGQNRAAPQAQGPQNPGMQGSQGMQSQGSQGSQQPGQQGVPNGPGSSMQFRPGQQTQPGQQGMSSAPSNFMLPGAQNTGSQGQGNQQGMQGQPGNQNPGNPNQPQNANASPLDAFSTLWQNPTQDGKAPTDPFSQPLLNADPNKIAEAARNHNFMQSVPQELVQKAMGGDFQAMMEVINNVGQQSLMVSAQLGAATTEHAGKNIFNRFDQAFEGRFKKQQLQSIKPSNPVLEHPNAAPMLQMLRTQAMQNNPSWNAQQAAQWAEQYLMELTGVMTPQQQPQQNNQFGQPEGQQDWDSWAGQ